MDTLTFEDTVEDLREAPAWDWSSPQAHRRTNGHLATYTERGWLDGSAEEIEPSVLQIRSSGERGVLTITATDVDGVARVAGDISRRALGRMSVIHVEADVRWSWIGRVSRDVPAAQRAAAILHALEELSAIAGQHTVAVTRQQELPQADA